METLEKLLAEIARLREGYALLEELRTIWGAYGPADEKALREGAQRSRALLNKFFHFDDSE